MHENNKGFLRAFLMVLPCLLIVFIFIFFGNKLNSWWTIGIAGFFVISHAMIMFRGCEENETKPDSKTKKEEENKPRSCCNKNH